ncbi:uncharacterized protein LOC141661761 [Apium graveolens]|uniref:uncharacterized protein LOC141661761 n=1 Tax=Apium graveolens TaxID=4045 RepID=UPI003D7A6D29
MTMFPPAATSTQHHQNLISCYTENRCYVDVNTTSGYGSYNLNQSIFGTQNFLNYVQGGEGYDNFLSAVNSSDHHQTASLVGSAYTQVMAEEDESKTETEISKTVHDHEKEAAGSSSKDLIKDPVDDEEGGGWLQLSIGSHTVTTGSSDYNQYHHDNENKLHYDGRLIMPLTRGDEEDIYRQQFVELDLLPNSSCGGGVNTEVKSNTNFTQELVIMNTSPAAAANSSTQEQQQQQRYYYSPVLPPRPTNLFLQHYYPPPPTATSSHYPLNHNYHNQQQVGNYQEYNPHWPTFRCSSASASSSFMPPVPSYFSRLPFQIHGASAASGVDASHHLPRFDFRVVDPPRRPHSGIWFTLQASQIQAKQPFLPQIPKSYLRIKERQMTIRVIIKYLVNKLRLDSEAEIEIRCKGQQLLPYLTLQHIRDSIWNPGDQSSSSDHLHHHLMVLHYGRTRAA